MFRKATAAILLASIPATLAIGVAMPDPASLGGSVQRADDVRLRAKLDGRSLASGQADYRERTRNDMSMFRFSVEIEDAEPFTNYEIAHNGKVFGDVTTDAFGAADFNRKTISDNSGEQGFVPAMVPGDTVAVVGLMSGVLSDD